MNFDRSKKSRFTANSLLAFALSPLAASIALADTAEPLEHMVVTATKTGETVLQDTPMAITLFTDEDIEASGIDNVQDLIQYTPGLNISENTSLARIYMRGVGTNLDFVGSDPSTTIHADGIYIGRPQAIFTNFLGVERIEVLRGPQGTLYGRNSTGGTINVISKTPDSEKFLETSLELGNYDKTRVSIGTGGSLVGETITGNLFAVKTQRDGYVENKASTGKDLNDDDSYGIKGALKIELSSDLTFIARADAHREDEAGIGYKPTLTNGLGEAPAQDPMNPIVPDDPWEVYLPAETIEPERNNYRRIDNNGGSFEIELDIGDVTLTSLSGYRSHEFSASIDSDWTENVTRLSTLNENQHQVSQELRIASQTEDLDWTLGTYYSRENAEWDIRVRLNTFPEQVVISEVETETKAMFANGTYHLNDQLSFNAGIRYSEEEKTFDTSVALPPPLSVQEHETESWYTTTPRVGVELRPMENQLLYFNVSEGFKSGGFNATFVGPAYQPEELRAYELGIKSIWLDQTLHTNMAVFYYDYKDMQVQTFAVANEGAPPQVVITNAAESTISGAELETLWIPNESFDLTFNVSYLDATYDEFVAERNRVGIDVSGNRLISAPRWKANAIGQVHTNMGNGRITSRLEWAWQTEQFLTEFNEPVTRQGTYGIWNSRISYSPSDESWSAAIYVQNIDNKDYTHAVQSFSPFGITKAINDPRTYGIVVAAQFY